MNKTANTRSLRSVALRVALTGVMVCLAPIAHAADETLRIGQLGDVRTFDPFQINTSTYVATNLLYDKLLHIDASGTPQPRLAESWSFSDDGKTITIEIVDDATFHDGRKMTSADVVFSVNYARDPNNATPIRAMAAMVESIEAIDDDTIVIKTRASQDVMTDMMDLVYVIDSERPDDIGKNANGTGPFKLVSNMPGVGVQFERFEDYWNESPEFARVELKVLPDSFAAVAQMRTGSVDFLSDIALDSLVQIEGTDFKNGVSAAHQIFNVGINVTRPPFDNPDVRKAITLAMDRERVAQEIGGPGSEIKCLPWVTYSLLPNENPKDLCEYNLEKARMMIEEAGATGADVEILSGGQTLKRISSLAQVMQATFNDIGLNATIADLSIPAFLQRFRVGEFDVSAHNYGRSTRNPATVVTSTVVFAPKNPQQYRSEEYNAAVAAFASLPSGTPEALSAREKVNELILNDIWVVSLASVPIRWASVPNLVGVEFTLDGGPVFARASFE